MLMNANPICTLEAASTLLRLSTSKGYCLASCHTYLLYVAPMLFLVGGVIQPMDISLYYDGPYFTGAHTPVGYA